MRTSEYIIAPGDSLSSIAQKNLGDASRWKEIAQLNRLDDPNKIYIGRTLKLPDRWDLAMRGTSAQSLSQQTQQTFDYSIPSFMGGHKASISYGRALFFVLADEINPFSKKLVRRVPLKPEILDPELLHKILHPEQYGFFPREPLSKVSPAQHVKGMTDSKHISASERFLGSPRHGETPYWIDVNKVKEAGIEIIPHETLIKDVEEAIKIAELDWNRVAQGGNPKKIDNFKRSFDSYKRSWGECVLDKESLIGGAIKPELGAIKGAPAMALTRGLQITGIIGLALTTYDLEKASRKAYEKGDIKILTREAVPQITGWAGAAAGLSIGGFAGTAFGITTGPGAVLIGGIGSLAGGFVGYIWGPDAVVKILPDRMKKYIIKDHDSQ